MKRNLLLLLLPFALILVLAGCKGNADEMSVESTSVDRTNCKHSMGYHNIPGILIRQVGSETVRTQFTSLYGGTEDENIVKFIQVFNIQRKNFDQMVKSYNLQVRAGVPFDVDVIYSGDQKRIEEYFREETATDE